MQARLKWWLIGIIALVIVALLAVLKPITLRSRINAENGRRITPAATIGKFKIYPPVPDLRLGLDLRGGMQIRLQLQKQAIFKYDIPEILKSALSEVDRSELQGKVGEVLSPEEIGTLKREIQVTDTGLEITTRVKDEKDMARQQKLVDAAILALYADAKPVAGFPDYIALEAGQLDDVMQNLESRINVYGVSEAIFQKEEPDKILVELPGVKDPKQAKDLLKATAMLEFRAIPNRYEVAASTYDLRTQEEEVTFQRRLAGGMAGEEVPVSKVLDESEIILQGKDLKNNARVYIGTGTPTAVLLEFKPEAAKKWANHTRKNIGSYVAIVLDGRVISCPVIKSAILEGRTQIEGGFNGSDGAKKAQALVIKLNAGSLPVDIVPVEERVVSATLGDDSMKQSLLAGLMGFILVLVFMIAYYRLPGALASLALVIYCALLLAVLKAFDATLTLPGIFGIILSIGMAVDANVIIFERIREELRAGKTMRAAIEAGFKRAWTAILDSNVCSILTGLVLYWLGTGAVKGFALTLIIGVGVSLFTAVTVTRLFMDIASESRLPVLIVLHQESSTPEIGRAHV